MLAAGVVLAGCSRESITSYQIPKEDYSPQDSAKMAGPDGGAGHSPEDSPMPHVHWDLPSGWQDHTSESQTVGDFRITGDEGKFAQVRIVPLRFVDGLEANSISMWREELALPEKAEDGKTPGSIQVAGTRGHFYDFVSEAPRFQDKFKARTTAAVFPRNGILWFVKMSGEESVVSREQENFKKFLASISMHDPEPDTSVASAAAEDSGAPDTAKWKIPSTWEATAAGQMIMAAYTAKTKAGASADITVSSFPGAVGGLLANVNRWRNQVQLAPIGESDLAKEVKTITLASGEAASVVDVTGTNARTSKTGRLYGLIVPRGGQTWFYKMFGDDAAVAAETSNLAEFAATAH